jgi:hypothetical protein
MTNIFWNSISKDAIIITHTVISNYLYEKMFLNKNNLHITNYKTEQRFNINYVVYYLA